ncbi:MAG TPA: bifunctional lysylphosphatidylglycerol flippase/synthetase MprF [Gemmatimonadaceae bacterium]
MPRHPGAPSFIHNVVHYLLPSILAAAAFVVVFLLRKRQPLERLLRISGHIAPAIVPRLLAVSTFLAGTILLFSGATPARAGRLGWLQDFLPIPVIVLSHFFGSIAGAGLLILARGLQRRIDAAYDLTIALLGAGIVFSLLKELDYEGAIILSLMLGALIPSRRYFYRRASLIEERFTPGWIVAILLVVVGSIVLGIISYGSPAVGASRFWDFSLRAQAPRFVRGTAGAIALFVILAIARLLRPARPVRTLPTAEELESVRPTVESQPHAEANLVFLGDKSLLMNEQRTGFVMYSVAGRSWVALGDPVAPPGQMAELAQKFVQLCDQHGGWAVFYKASREQLYLYLDLGLSVVKLGEEARVPLRDFALEGPERRNLRRMWRHAVQEGCTFEVVGAESVRPLIPQLRAISDEWLAAKRTREKRFSLGFFDERYLERYPAALVRKRGALVAFANIWTSGDCDELSVDLMRFSSHAPPGIMRYLFVELMLWGRAQEYRWFNLGMAPLSGLRASAIAPLWNQLGTAIYGHGERFYNFQGIRDFKDWFHPVWEPKYLVSASGAARPVIVASIASLIAGGLEGVVRK